VSVEQQTALERAARPQVHGRLTEVVGLVLEAGGCPAAIGETCEVLPGGGRARVPLEVVGLRNGRTLLMPLGAVSGLEVGMPVRRCGGAATVSVGRGLLGRVVDGLGRPIDGGGPIAKDDRVPLDADPSHPLSRRPVEVPLPVGVRAIDGMLTLGVGQRVGVFAGGGVGKSTLLAMMVRRAKADVCVVGLIGERGREVEEMVNRTLGVGLARSVVVAATSADPPLARVRGALLATAYAEYFRSLGLKVLLVMDSVTRFAMAMREIGLAIGEPPTTKGYTPSVFAALPRLLERAGTCDGPGAITGVYTVLVEGDDLSDPIADAARAILDGHIVLSRHLAERGHFPAIDVSRSVSRVFGDVTEPAHRELVNRARGTLADFGEAQDLMSIGAYAQGVFPHLDEAVARKPGLEAFLRQGTDEGGTDLGETVAALGEVWS